MSMGLRNYQGPSAKKSAGLGLLGMIVVVAIVAAVAYYFLYKPRPLPVANANSSPHMPRMVEFETLLADGTPFASFAQPGEYTVVEVYLDVCAYCRDLEAAFESFNDRRPDVRLVRVHHPGAIEVRFSGNSNAEIQAQAEEFDAKMRSYGLCGTPHVEVYGPDGQALATDSCGSRAGTAFIWKWITQESGIKPKLSRGGITGL